MNPANPNNENNNEKSRRTVFFIARGAAISAAAFCILLCVLIMLNYFQVKTMDPLNSPALNQLMQKLKDNPKDKALRDEIRALDLLARKAYFTGQWQLRSGGYMLLAGLMLLLGTLKVMGGQRRKYPELLGCDGPDDGWLSAVSARKWLAATGVFLLVTTLATALLTQSELTRDDPFAAAADSAVSDQYLNQWPAFRGPGGNGVATTTNAPLAWDGKSGKGVLWKVKTPLPGYSSPVIWDTKLFLTGADKKNREVYCYDRETGKLLWQKPVPEKKGDDKEDNQKVPRIHDDTGYAAPSAATDGKYVCAVFATGHLACFDMDGNRVWGQNLGMPDNQYGHSSSLLIHGNILILQWDQSENSHLSGLDISTGNTVWRVQRSVISWSSPICVNTGKRFELILTNSTSLDSYDPQTGVKLWSQNVLGGEMGPSAHFANGIVFGVNDFAVAAGVRIGQKAGEPPAKLLWEWDENLPDTASPVATDKYVFLATSKGFMVCLDAVTGKMIWEQEYDDSFYSSPILVGENVYAMDLQGVMHIFKADKTYQSLGDNKLGESSACTPAFMDDGRMYVRGDRSLFCITGSGNK